MMNADYGILSSHGGEQLSICLMRSRTGKTSDFWRESQTPRSGGRAKSKELNDMIRDLIEIILLMPIMILVCVFGGFGLFG